MCSCQYLEEALPPSQEAGRVFEEEKSCLDDYHWTVSNFSCTHKSKGGEGEGLLGLLLGTVK